MSLYYLGIDVAKLTLDLALCEDEPQQKKKTLYKQVNNAAKGHQTLLAWLEQQGVPRDQVHVCLEATGHFGDGVAHCLQQAGVAVSVVNPALIKAYAKAFQPKLWQPLPPHILELRTQVRHLASLEKHIQQTRNRLQAQLPSAVVQDSLHRVLACLTAELKACKKTVQAFLKQQPELLALARLIAEIGDMTRFDSPEQLVAFIGLDPSRHESGTSVRKPSQISRQGNNRARAALYFPAIVAKKHNPIIRAFCQRLQERHKKPKEQVVAAMRKLLHLVYGVWKSGKPFDPNFLAQKT